MGLDFDISVWLVGIVSLLVVLVILWKRGDNAPRLFFLSVFWIYLLFVLKIAVFPIPVARGISTDTAQQLMPVMLSTINHRLFFFGHYATFESIVITVLQNLILMIPFGFGINFIKPRKPREILWLSIVVGSGIEAIQFVIALIAVFIGTWGPEHIVDINDALLNMIGVLLGYGLFRLFTTWYTPLQHKFKTNEFFAYIQGIARQV
ncbi:MAG TPA: VanZ family protein [Anaerolineales bacterium]|nr:VanZ family protein [Anaerolineales bacterium]